MTTAHEDREVGKRPRSTSVIGVVVFVLGLVICGYLWVLIDGADMIHDVSLEARESSAGNAAFGPVRDQVLALITSNKPLQTTVEHSDVMYDSSNCFEVEAEWLVPFDQPSDEFPHRFQSSDVFSGWRYSEYRDYTYPYYQFTSSDDKLSLTITYDEKDWNKPNLPAGYEVWLTYHTPSQSKCRP